MGIIAKKPTSSYQIATEGSHTGTLAEVEDKGLQPNPFQKDTNGLPKMRHQVVLVWTLEDGATIKEWQTLSLHEKANLPGIVKALTGSIPQEDDEVDLEDLIGEQCRLEIEHQRGRDGKMWPRIAGHFALGTQRRA